MRPFRERSLRVAVSVLAIVGFLDIFGRAVFIPFTGNYFGVPLLLPPGIKVERIAKSVSGRFNAVVLSQQGSGLDPHCTVLVSVIAASLTIAASWAPENRVYVSDCAEDIAPSWSPSADALLSGRGPVRDHLSINADPNEAWSVSRIAEGGSVVISFASRKDSPRLP